LLFADGLTWRGEIEFSQRRELPQHIDQLERQRRQANEEEDRRADVNWVPGKIPEHQGSMERTLIEESEKYSTQPTSQQ
jgi:hypothetical protein